MHILSYLMSSFGVDSNLEVCQRGIKDTSCCTREMEHHYHRAAERDFKSVLNSTSFYLSDLLNANLQYYQGQ